MRALGAFCLFLFCACNTPGPPPGTAPRPQPPADLEQLLRQYQVDRGYQLTYDDSTARHLGAIRVQPVGNGELGVLLLTKGDPEAVEAGFQIYSLRHARADELARSLKELVDSARGESSQPTILIETDERTNALLVRAPVDHLARIAELITLLDVRAEQGG